jgi:hypothetical protein
MTGLAGPAVAGFLAALAGVLAVLGFAAGALAARVADALLALALAPEAARGPALALAPEAALLPVPAFAREAARGPALAFGPEAALAAPVARLPVAEVGASLAAVSGAVVTCTASLGWAARLLLRRWGRERGSAPSTLAPSSFDEDVGRCSLMIVGSPACAVVNFRSIASRRHSSVDGARKFFRPD